MPKPLINLSAKSSNRKIDIVKDVEKTLLRLHKSQPKHAGQISRKLLMLSDNPLPQDAQPMKGAEGYCRADIGEYRIIYRFDDQNLYIVGLGKRNDSDVYKQFKRKWH